MSEERITITEIVRYEDGHVALVVTLFESLPGWAKTKINPVWDHPSGCECHTCWQLMECTR